MVGMKENEEQFEKRINEQAQLYNSIIKDLET